MDSFQAISRQRSFPLCGITFCETPVRSAATTLKAPDRDDAATHSALKRKAARDDFRIAQDAASADARYMSVTSG
jgi:hypothetical protein